MTRTTHIPAPITLTEYMQLMYRLDALGGHDE